MMRTVAIGKEQTMSDCEVCIYELIGHKFGKMIHKTCREDTRCPFYKPKEAKGEASDEQTTETVSVLRVGNDSR